MSKGRLEQFMEQFPTPVQALLYLGGGGILILVSYSLANAEWAGTALLFGFILGGLMILTGAVKLLQSTVDGLRKLAHRLRNSKRGSP